LPGMADRRWAPMDAGSAEHGEEEPLSDDEEETGQERGGLHAATAARPWVLFAACALLTAAFLGGGAWFVSRRGSDLSDALKPTWEVTKVTIENLHLPGIKGLVPADISACPGSDPCGVAGSKGCSKCPSEKFWNDGCLCRQNAKGGGAPSGEVVTADTSACPSSDPCGTEPLSSMCARCPDSSWIREGCSCRQPPISPSEFLHDVGEFFGALTGVTESFVELDVEAIVEVKNPASVGAVAEPGLFNVTFHGVQIASAATPETPVPPAGIARIVAQARVHVNLNSETGARMIEDVLNDDRLAVQVQGSALSRVTPLVVRCAVSCNIVMTDVHSAQTTKFPQKDCTYGYTLLPRLAG